jgi:hypothetical protein
MELLRMREAGWLSDDDLARAHVDPAFRHQLLADSLDRLITEIAKLRDGGVDDDPVKARQMREGADLALQLADLLQGIPEVSSRNPNTA